MKAAWLWILALVMVWPIHWTAATVQNKPIDLMSSDLLLLLMPFTYLFARTTPRAAESKLVKVPIRSHKITMGLALVFILYATSLAGVGLGLSGETVRIYSAFKLAKPIGYIFLGMLLGSWCDPVEVIQITGRAYAVIVGLTMFFTVTAPEFPLGEWGKYIYEWELSGYPNSPMSFYAVLVPVLLASVESTRSGYAPIGWGLVVCAALMILGSMSRSSTLALTVGLIIYLSITGRGHFLFASIVAIVFMSVVGFGIFAAIQETEFGSVLSDRIQERLERSTEQEDPSSGRFDIWKLAIELWTESPVFGYMFESFSRYAEVDTPHQQYLEVLHKCGGVGLLLYAGLLFSCISMARRLLSIAPPRSPAWYHLSSIIAMLGGVMVGNLTQPNLTYSLTGNMVFLLCGCLTSSRATISASQPIARPIAGSPIGIQTALRRAA